MGVQTEELRTVLTVDGSQADQALKKHADNIENIGRKASKTTDVSKQLTDEIGNGLRKTGRAGNVAAEAMSAIGGRLALVAGTAAVAGVAIYKGLKFINEASIHAQTLHDEVESLGRIPASGGAFRQIGEMDSHLQKVTTKLEELRQARGTISTSPREIIGDLAAFGRTPGQEREEQLRTATAAAKADARDIAESYRITAGISNELIHGSEKGAELDKAHLEYLKENAALSELLKDPALAEEANKALAAQASIYVTQKEQIEKKHDLITSEIALEGRLVELHAQGLSTDKERLAILQQRVDEASKLAFNATSEEEKASRNVALGAAGNSLLDEQRRQALEKRRDPAGFARRQQQEELDRKQADADIAAQKRSEATQVRGTIYTDFDSTFHRGRATPKRPSPIGPVIDKHHAESDPTPTILKQIHAQIAAIGTKLAVA